MNICNKRRHQLCNTYDLQKLLIIITKEFSKGFLLTVDYLTPIFDHTQHYQTNFIINQFEISYYII